MICQSCTVSCLQPSHGHLSYFRSMENKKSAMVLLILPSVGASWSHDRDTAPIARHQCKSNRAIVSIVGVSLGGSDIILCIGPGCGASRRCCSHPPVTAMAGEQSSGPRPSEGGNGSAKLVGWSFGKLRMYINFFPGLRIKSPIRVQALPLGCDWILPVSGDFIRISAWRKSIDIETYEKVSDCAALCGVGIGGSGGHRQVAFLPFGPMAIFIYNSYIKPVNPGLLYLEGEIPPQPPDNQRGYTALFLT